MGEEKDDLLEREKDLKKKDCLLSREGWIMLLSDEIQNCKVLFMMVGVLIVSSLLAIIGIVVMVLGSALFPLFVILALYLGLCFFISLNLHQKRLRPLINTREDIISGKLIDLSKINRIWKYYIKKYYGKLLAKSEMDKEEKESKGEKDCPLSPTDWAMFLSSEIYNMKHPDFVKIINPIMLFLIAYIGYMIASVNTVLASVFYSLYPPILALFAVTCSIVFIYWLIDFYMVGKREKALKELRRKIIFEEEKDCIKIREDWWNIVSKKGIKIIRRCRELILRFVTGYRDSKYDKKN